MRAPIAAGDFGLALARLRAREDSDGDVPGYYELLGALALKTGDASLAAAALERAVLFRPERAGAWLDLAFAAAAQGDTSSAGAYLEHIETRFDPPPALRQVIAGLRARMQAAPRPQRFWRGEATLLAGRDSNANAGLSIDHLSLTLPSGPLNAEIAPESRAHGDTTGVAQAFLHWRRPAGAGGDDGPGRLFRRILGTDADLEAYGLWRERLYSNESAFRTRSLVAGGVIGWPIAGSVIANLGLQAEQLDRGGITVYRAQRLVASGERALRLVSESGGWRDWLGGDRAQCRAGGGLEAEVRNYPTQPTLDGHIVWLTGQARCPNGPLGGESALSLRLGQDRPTAADRPGGSTQRVEARGLVTTRLAPNVRLEALFYLDVARDADGYSPLLEGGAARRLTRLGARLEIARAFAPGWEALAVLEAAKQQSNLPIFRQNDGSVLAGVRYRF